MIWRKPVRKPRYLPNTLWKRVPEQLAVRVLRLQLTVPGFRPESITLVTTLTDARGYVTPSAATGASAWSKPGEKPFAEDWAEHKRREKELEEAKHVRSTGAR